MTRVVFIFVLLFSLACEDPPLELNKIERREVDTMVNHQIKILRPQLDSICDNRRSTLVKNAVDSIMKKRMNEIELLTGKKQ